MINYKERDQRLLDGHDDNINNDEEEGGVNTQIQINWERTKTTIQLILIISGIYIHSIKLYNA